MGITVAMTDRVMVFAPTPILTVTLEQQTSGAELHVHPGGQGVWQARMIAALGVPVTLCAALGGETGDVLARQLEAEIRDAGVGAVLISRAGDPALALLDDDRVVEVHPPALQVVEHRGAGDSMTAGVAVVLARGGDVEEAVRMGAAAGALNITRHGLGTGRAEAVQELYGRVRLA
jgi:fructose-1-phosphate kinase PfkB-like protein